MDNTKEIIDLTKGVDTSLWNAEEDAVKYQEASSDDAISRQLDELYRVFNTFLDKMSANPDAPQIKWPQRMDDISKVRTQITTIYKGE
jgi:hypothetical protein